MIHSVSCSIKGVPPGLLMHSFPMVDPPKGWEKWDGEEQAVLAEYRNSEGKLYIPGSALQRCLVAAAAYSKGKGRASLQKPIAACVFVTPEYMPITPQEYKVDSRPVVVPATKGRIVRHRPWFPEWESACEIQFDDALISEKELREVVDNAGSRVGLLDFRPANKGPFGRFMVTKWQG